MNRICYGLTAGVLLLSAMMMQAKEFAVNLNYRICIPDSPSKMELAAAGQLHSYLQRIYGKKIRMNGSEKEILFSVGFAPEAKKFSKEKDGLKESGFGVFCRERQVLLTGLDDPDEGEEGTLLSVYYFLRKYAGWKVYAPDPVHGEKIVRDPVLTLPSADKPVFSFTVRDMSRFFTDTTAGQMALYARKQLCHNPRWANANVYYTVLNKWGKRFKDQKDLLGLYRGKRQSILYPYHLPCLTNPKVKEVILRDILEMIRARKVQNRVILRIFCDAPFKRCECKNCAGISNNNDYLYSFILSVWNEVKKKYPETGLVLQEKGKSHNLPPAKGDLKGVVVDIASGFPGKMDYRKSRSVFRQWKERGALPTLRLYPRYPRWGNAPLINPHDIAANCRALKGLSLGQRRSDGMSSQRAKRNRIPYAFAALTNFVHMNCLLYADSDVEKLIRDFCSFMYPGAAREMIAFYSWMEKRQENLGAWEDPRMNCYPFEALEYPASLLEKASKKCTNPFWLNKLRTAFQAFREETRSLRHLTAYREKNLLEKERLLAEYRKYFVKGFFFSGKATVFPLCPQKVPYATAIQNSSVQIHREKDRLVFRLTAMENQIRQIGRTATKANPDPIWNDDSFEIMIAPEKQEMPYFHFAVNPNGAVAAHRYVLRNNQRTMEKLSGEWKSSSSIGKDRWSAEYSIPLSLLRQICPEGKGRIGIFRSRVLSGFKAELRDYYMARSSLDVHSIDLKNYHIIRTYHPFTLSLP